MHRKIIPLVLVLFLAACSISPLPQATAISPTNPPPTITDTPQPTFTPEPTLTSTPIPDPYVIRDGVLIAWDSSLGEYQPVVLSNGALPEGAQIIENEIVAPDGAVLYHFDANTGDWAFTVPIDIQAQIGIFWRTGDVGNPSRRHDGHHWDKRNSTGSRNRERLGDYREPETSGGNFRLREYYGWYLYIFTGNRNP